MEQNRFSGEKGSQPLTYADFERLRCGKCNEYLNCPPIMAFIGRENYLECGRCYDEKSAKLENVFPVKNKSLELLASITPFPCKHYEDGCMERRTWPAIEVHEAECLQRTFRCPLFVLDSCRFESGMQKLVEHFGKDHSSFFLTDGRLNELFDTNFENHYLVQQNTNLFIFQVKYNTNSNKAWFAVNLLEERSVLEFSLEFVGNDAERSFVMRSKAVFKSLSKINENEALEIDIKAVRSLVGDPVNIGCKVYLSAKFSSLRAMELLKEIQCPVCWEYMKGKIFLCKNGHNVCLRCKEFVNASCPSCRDVFLDVRNLSLEKVIATAVFPCKNFDVGCIYIGSIDEMLYHYENCLLGEL